MRLTNQYLVYVLHQTSHFKENPILKTNQLIIFITTNKKVYQIVKSMIKIEIIYIRKCKLIIH